MHVMVSDPVDFAARPRALMPGDHVRVVAPASDIKRDALEAGCKALRELGYQVSYDESILDRELYFAGSVERRARELEAAFADQQVKAIVCARGGYGCNYLLPNLKLDVLLGNPKIFVGYSDLTSLMTYLTDHGLVTFQGPMVAKDWAHADGVELAAWRAIMGGEGYAVHSTVQSELQPLAPGSAKAVLYGGCLSMLVASLGTPYEAQTEGKLLFIEDVGAKPYQIDRMLMQMKLAGKFEGVKGVLFGEMIDCIQPGGQSYSLQEIVLRIVGELGVPVAYGFRSGHVSAGNTVLPFGVSARLVVGKNEVMFEVEPATVPPRGNSSGAHSAHS